MVSHHQADRDKEQMTILVAAGDPNVLSFVSGALRFLPQDWCIKGTGSLSMAQGYIDRDIPQLAIIDTELNDGSGLDLLSTNGRRPQFPTILLADPDSPQAELPGLTAGVMTVVVKRPECMSALSGIAQRTMKEWRHLRILMGAEREYIEGGETLRHSARLEALGHSASRVAHELNNILAPIVANAELALLDISEDNMARNNIDDIIVAATRAGLLVKQILNFSRKQSAETEPFELKTVVEEATRQVEAILPESVSLRLELDPECGMILADPLSIHQIILNLCVNACDAMKESGGTLVLGLAPILANAQLAQACGIIEGEAYFRLTITDSGSGMDPDILDRLFEPFFTTKSRGQGTGLGLAVTREIVNGCRGGITVKTTPGEGSEFSVYLPDADRQVCREENGSHKAEAKDAHVLIVGSPATVASAATRILEQSGYRVTMARRGDEALLAFRANPQKFDVLIADEWAPSFTSDWITRVAEHRQGNLPIILLSSLPNQALARIWHGADISECVRKPLQRDDLVKAVQNVLGVADSGEQQEDRAALANNGDGESGNPTN